MIRFFTALIVLLTATVVSAQKPVFQGQVQKNALHKKLNDHLEHWEVYKIDAAALDGFVKKAGQSASFALELGGHDWDIELQKRDLRSPGYISSTLGGDGVKTTSAFDGTMTYRGQMQGQSGWSVALTLNESFIYGYFVDGGETYFIEPLSYFLPGQPDDQYIVYAASAAKTDDSHKCGVEAMHEKMQELNPHEHGKDHGNSAEKMMGCVTVDLAIASDLSMFTALGSVGGVNGFTFGVMNNVQTNYDNEFADEIQFSIVEQFVVAPPASDPWTNSASAGALLDDFTDWGPSGFNASHDLGQLWTNRDLSGGTVGVAWLDAVCTSFRYHVVSRFTTNANFLRVMTAHEIGHNFGAVHDGGSGFIMSPSVNNTTTWSAASISTISSTAASSSCLAGCSGSQQSPIAAFDFSQNSDCTPVIVQFNDNSQNTPDTWNWTFPGGTPSTSNLQNPVVLYNSPGTFSASLTVGNSAGSNSITQNNVIVVLASPVAAFTQDVNGLTVTLTNMSSFGTSYLWNFGDGNTSTAFSPVHTYAVDGFYDVTLNVTNNCGTEMLMVNVAAFELPTAAFSSTATTGCPGATISFINQSSSNALSLNWSFPGGNPSTSTAPFPNVTYAAPGVYNVTLTASNPAGDDVNVQTGYITIGAAPTANFTSVVSGNTVAFTSTSTNPAGSGSLQYLWDFGDGNTSTLQNPTHTYTSGGIFNATLTVTNLCGSNSKVNPVTLQLPPVASFSANVTSGCAPLSVSFTSNSQGVASYNWSFPGGTPSSSTAQNPTVVYNTAGSFNVSLTVANASGNNTATETNFITVANSPSASFTNVVSGNAAAFTNTSNNATSYSWNFGDGNTSTSASPTHTYAADGTYTVVLSATNACGTVTSTQTVVIATPPVAGFTAGATSGCAPLTVQYTNQSSSNVTAWSWSFPGGTPSTSTQQNPVVVYNTAGTYSASLTVSNSVGNNTATQNNLVTVSTTPTAGFTNSANGSTVAFSNTSSNATSYSWNFGDGNTSTAASPSHTYANNGSYTVVLSATNACGTVTSTQTVVVAIAPTAAFTANTTSGCGPLTVQFTNQSSSNAASWAWSFPGGTPSTSTQQNPTVVYSTPGSYDVTLVATNAAGSVTASQTSYINVLAPPAASFTATTNVFVANFTNTSTNATSYAWNFGDGGTSTSASPSHTFGGDGTYTVTLTATGACGTTTTTQQVVISSLPAAAFSANATSGCAPLTVQFQNQSSSNVTAWSWSFPGGSPATSTAQNPTVVYSTPGSYNVSLTVSNALGQNTASQTNYITVNAAATAGFGVATNLLAASFTNTSTNATSYAWSFGDGNTSTSANPSHTYAADGTYTVTLSATNACGTVTSTQAVTVATMPAAGFTANVTSGCAPLTVVFDNQSSANATGYAWSFPGGTPSSSTLENPTVVYNTAGTYTVTLVVSNAAGQSTATQTNYITVNAAPTASFTGSLAGATATFNNTTTNGTSYLWNFGDGTTSTEASPSHTYLTDGVFNVVLTATNACGSTTVNGQFTVVTMPSAGFVATNAIGCSPLQVQYQNQSSDNAATYAWSFPGGTPSSSTEENPVVVYNTAGVYSATLTVTNAAGTDSETLTDIVKVEAAPAASFVSLVNADVVSFTNTSNNATSFAWMFGDGGTSTDENPTHTYDEDGVYPVTLVATNECGETVVTNNVVISVSGAPIAFFVAEGNNGCTPLTVTFSNESENTVSYAWTFPGGTPSSSTEENPSVVYNVPGTYDVSLTASNAQGSSTYTQTGFVVVNDIPLPSFTSVTNFNIVTFTNTTAGATSYAWDFGDGSPISTEANPTHTYAAGGQYQVTLTATNACGSKAVTLDVTAGANGTEDIPGISRFEVFPNPNSGNFVLLMDGMPQAEMLELSFVNVLGQRIFHERADFRTGHISKDFSFSNLAAGVYILQVKSGERAMFKKLVVE